MQALAVLLHPLMPIRTARRLVPALQQAIDHAVATRRIDAIIVEHQSLAAYVRMRYLAQVKVAVRVQSLSYKAYFRTAAHSALGPMKLINAFQGYVARRYEQSMHRNPPFHEAWFLMADDIAEVAVFAPAIRRIAKVLPIGATASPLDNHTETIPYAGFAPNDKVVVFIGSMTNPTNEDGARWLADRIMPAVRATVPQAKLCVVGRNAAPALADIVSDQVVVVSDAPDLAPFLARADAYAVAERGRPGAHVSGVHMKLIDGLSSGKPIIASPVGTGGVEGLRAGEHYLAAHDEGEFVAHVAEVLAHPDRYRAMARASFEFYQQNFTGKLAGRAVIDRLTALVGAGGPSR